MFYSLYMAVVEWKSGYPQQALVHAKTCLVGIKQMSSFKQIGYAVSPSHPPLFSPLPSSLFMSFPPFLLPRPSLPQLYSLYFFLYPTSPPITTPLPALLELFPTFFFLSPSSPFSFFSFFSFFFSSFKLG